MQRMLRSKGLMKKYNLSSGIQMINRFSENVRRNDQFDNPLDHLEQLRGLLESGEVISDDREVETYNVDWTKNYRGHSPIVL